MLDNQLSGTEDNEATSLYLRADTPGAVQMQEAAYCHLTSRPNDYAAHGCSECGRDVRGAIAAGGIRVTT